MARHIVIAACAALAIGGQVQGAPYSALPWVSGVSSPGGPFGAWRGQPVDVIVGWLDGFKQGWPELVADVEKRSFGGDWRSAKVSLGVPLLTAATRGRFKECAAGDYDGYVRRIATALGDKTSGLKKPLVLRLAWEANGTVSYPWYAKNDPDGFIACFRRQAMIYRQVVPDALIELAHNKGKMDVARKIWPGGDVVDIIGRHGYDGDPPINSEADWQAFVGGEKGPDTWAAYARERGKRLAMAEWGVGRNGDNPLFIAKMFEWFQANADIVSYEAYFNRSEYGLYAPSSNPQSAAMYRRLWGGGGRLALSAP